MANKQTPNDQRSRALNPQHDEHKHAVDNKSVQNDPLNPRNKPPQPKGETAPKPK